MTIFDRGYSFYVVVNIPRPLIPIFKRKQIWKSLHTRDKKVANIRSLSTIARINAMFVREMQMKHIKGFGDEYDKDFDIEFDRIFSSVKRIQEPYEYSDGAIEDIALDFCIEQISEDKGKVIKSVDTLNYYNLLLKEYIEEYHLGHFAAIESSLERYLYYKKMQKPTESCKENMLRAFLLAFIQYLEFIIEYIKGAEIRNYPIKLISSPPLIEQLQKTNLDPITYKKPNLTLSELAETYNNELSRNNVSQAQKNKINQRMRVISELLNNKKIRDIEPEDLQELVLTLQFLPLRLKSEQIAHLDKIINENKKHPEKCISDKTRADYVQSLKSIFTWALKRKYIRENVMDEIDIPSPEKTKEITKYQPFTVQQLQKIFHSDFYSKHWDNNRQRRSFFWIGLLGLYTGARLNEICQLQFDDIQEEYGIKFISINENDGKHVKTKAGIRKIPIHQELIKLGFLEFVNFMKKQSPTKNKRIFMDLEPNTRGELSAQPSKWFGKLLDSLGLKDKGLVFHSFRHTVRTILRNNNCPIDRVQRLCGWEGSNSLSEHYGTISIKVLADEINGKLVFEGLNLSHLHI